MFLSPIHKTRPWHLWASTSIQHNSARQQPMWMPSWHKERLLCMWPSSSLGFLANFNWMLASLLPPYHAANLEMKESIWTSNPQLKFCDSWLKKWKWNFSVVQGPKMEWTSKTRKIEKWTFPGVLRRRCILWTSPHADVTKPSSQLHRRCSLLRYQRIPTVAIGMLSLGEVGVMDGTKWQANDARLQLHVKGRCECQPDLREIAESRRRRLFTAFSLQDCVW